MENGSGGGTRSPSSARGEAMWTPHVRVCIPARIYALVPFLEAGKVLEHPPDSKIEKAAARENTERIES